MKDKKQCSKCKKIKLLSEFYNNNKSKDGKSFYCIDCYKKYAKKYREDHRKQIRKNSKKHYETHKEYQKEYRETHKEYHKEYRETHKKYNKKYNKEYRETHKNRRNQYLKERKKDPFIHLNDNISAGIRLSLYGNKNGRHWETLVNFKLKELKKHLESLFTEGMNWNNYGKWHIDHKIPVSLWKFKNPEDTEFKQCWSLCNLQPLWAEENLKKSNKVA